MLVRLRVLMLAAVAGLVTGDPVLGRAAEPQTRAPQGVAEAHLRAARGAFFAQRLPGPSPERGDGGGVCISFRTPGGSWSRPVALSPLFGDIRVYAASVTPDGRWLFLSATGRRAGLYWMSADALKTLRPREFD